MSSDIFWDQKIFERIWGSLSSPMLVCDISGRVIYGNDAAQKAFFVEVSKPILWPEIFSLLPSLVPKVWEDLLFRARVSEKSALECKVENEKFCYSINASFLSSSADSPLVLYFDKKSVQMVQEEHFIEENLLQVQKMEALSRLAGGIAHDFNNIFSGIQGYLKILKLKLKDDKEIEQDLEEVLSGIEDASRLTNRLIEYSRRDIKRPSLLNMNHYFQRIRERCEIFLGNEMDFNLELEPDLHLVSLDTHQCDRIIEHLLENARDAMEPGGCVKIITSNQHYSGGDLRIPPGDYVSICFSDNGCGIDAAIKEHIFEPFYTTKGGKATGLGLSTIYGLVKQNNGIISLCSGQEPGTSFEILLPAITTTATKLDPEDGKVVGGSEGVLLVDDEDIVRPLVKKILDDYGYLVWEAHEGHEALEIFLENQDKIHLCLTDVIMPGMKGNELAAKLVEIKPELKVIYFSGYPENIIAGLGVLDKGVNFVYKPFTAKALLNKIRVVLDGG